MRWKTDPDVSICGCAGAENPEEMIMAIPPTLLHVLTLSLYS